MTSSDSEFDISEANDDLNSSSSITHKENISSTTKCLELIKEFASWEDFELWKRDSGEWWVADFHSKK